MADDPVEQVLRRARRLTSSDLAKLVEACRGGLTQLEAFEAAQHPMVRDSCRTIRRAAQTIPCAELAGLVDGVRRARDVDAPRPEPVWTGPEVDQSAHRLTNAVVADLVGEATESVLLVSYAMHTEKHLRAALAAAIDKGVRVRVVAERACDNPSFSGVGVPFSDLAVERYAWPASERPDGASLHAKLLVVDRRIALVGSANLTQSAMQKNLECGLIVRDVPVAETLEGHIDALVSAGSLVSISG